MKAPKVECDCPEKGKNIGKEAMRRSEGRLDRQRGLSEWFVNIAPAPTSLKDAAAQSDGASLHAT